MNIRVLSAATTALGVEASAMNMYLVGLLLRNGVRSAREKFVVCRSVVDALQIGYVAFWIAPTTFFQSSGWLFDYIGSALTRLSAVLWCCSIMIQVITVIERHFAICHGLLHMAFSDTILVKVSILGTIAFSMVFVQGFWFLTHCRGGYDMKHVVFTFDGDDCKLHLNRLAALGFMLATLALTFTLDTMTYLKLKNMNSKLTRQSSFTKHQRASRQRCEDYVLTQTFVLPLTLLLQHALFFVRSTDFTKFDSIVLNFTFNMLVIIVIYQIEAIVELITNKSLNSFLYRLWNRRRSRERTPPESNQLLKRRGAMQTDVIVIDISK
ncbi:unnamed protein product [Bursaphelenchus xylophilus]|uniref:(pine wood nematode) hypothetical protein n=1 Tax=Bursaphelenchus xylophilus TaxID=6326 RepID=A0A7I8WLX5_BURXY|nr:unnamed protein product [Bursaphelenchus xylophilus]CAG9104768.1 unnamed protein product [Bursaphelenchus xylophilus]